MQDWFLQQSHPKIRMILREMCKNHNILLNRPCHKKVLVVQNLQSSSEHTDKNMVCWNDVHWKDASRIVLWPQRQSEIRNIKGSFSSRWIICLIPSHWKILHQWWFVSKSPEKLLFSPAQLLHLLQSVLNMSGNPCVSVEQWRPG